jgi:hypothetical protein
MTAKSITSVGRNMNVKRNRLNPKARFWPGNTLRAMRSREVERSW